MLGKQIKGQIEFRSAIWTCAVLMVKIAFKIPIQNAILVHRNCQKFTTYDVVHKISVIYSFGVFIESCQIGALKMKGNHNLY